MKIHESVFYCKNFHIFTQLQGGLNPDFQGIRNYKRQAAYGAPSAPTASVGNSYSSPSGAPSAPTGNSYGRPAPGSGASGAPSAPVGDSYGSPNAPPIRYGINMDSL